MLNLPKQIQHVPAVSPAGVLWMFAAMSAIAIIDAVAKVLARDLHGVQVAWGYFLAMLVALLVVAAVRRVSPAALIATRRPGLQAARALCLVMSLSCLFFSLRYLPLAEVTTMAFSAPLFIVALSGPLLGERVDRGRWLAVTAGMAGAVLVARPGTGLLHWSALVTIAGAFFFAGFNLVTRTLGAGERPMATLFYTFAIGTAVLSAVMPLVWRPPGAFAWGVFLCTGALGLFAHFAIVRALAVCDASAVAPLNYVRLVWALGLGYVLFGDVPDAVTLLGGSIIVASGLYVLRPR